jgi:hypothetical protein
VDEVHPTSVLGSRYVRVVSPDQQQIPWVVKSYASHYWLGLGDRQQRLLSEEHFWAWEAVKDLIENDSRPVELIDALLHESRSEEGYRSYVAAGPLEDLLVLRPEFAEVVAARSRHSPVWAEAAAGVWLDRVSWQRLPEGLQRLIPEPSSDPSPAPKRKTAKPRPSKRQGHRPRHP